MNAETTRETSANDALPEGLRIKGRVPSVHQDATFKSKPSRGWYITNARGAAGMYYLTNRGEWTNGIQSNADSFWPTRAAALEACYLHADLPEGWSITAVNGSFKVEKRLDGEFRYGVWKDTARDAYLVVMAAATQAPNASERPDAELLKLLSSARKSFAMHNGIILQACEGMSFDDFAAVVEGLRTLHQRHDPAELTRLREELARLKSETAQAVADLKAVAEARIKQVLAERDEARRLLGEAHKPLIDLRDDEMPDDLPGAVIYIIEHANEGWRTVGDMLKEVARLTNELHDARLNQASARAAGGE
jgi:hypothetical protein